MQNWRDNSRLRLPGYRDRVAAVRLKPGEGGLNLNMTPARITALAQRGRDAADELALHFNPTRSSELPADVKTTWENHRWVRLLSTLSGMETSIKGFEAAWDAPAEGTPSYEELLDPTISSSADLPSYQRVANAQRELAPVSDATPRQTGSSARARSLADDGEHSSSRAALVD